MSRTHPKTERRGGARPGSGPKPRPVAEHRRNRIMLNFTDAEYEALARAAEDTIPSYARELVLRALAAEKSRPEPTSKAPARRKA